MTGKDYGVRIQCEAAPAQHNLNENPATARFVFSATMPDTSRVGSVYVYGIDAAERELRHLYALAAEEAVRQLREEHKPKPVAFGEPVAWFDGPTGRREKP
jgi:hypothetical protein